MMLLKEGENNHTRFMMEWVDHIEQLKKMEILDKDEAALFKERLIGEW